MDVRFGSPDILRMFPTFVWKCELAPEVHRAINEGVLEWLDEARRSMPALEAGHGWQSDQALHKLRQFGELVSCIDEAATNVLDFLEIGHQGFEVTACWANLSPGGAAHRIHSHPNNFLSGVYYVETHEGADTINFHDPRSQAAIIRPPVTRLTAENTDQREVVVKVTNGTLMMFPAWLRHSVDPNRSDRIRISISFNIMFS